MTMDFQNPPERPGWTWTVWEMEQSQDANCRTHLLYQSDLHIRHFVTNRLTLKDKEDGQRTAAFAGMTSADSAVKSPR